MRVITRREWNGGSAAKKPTFQFFPRLARSCPRRRGGYIPVHRARTTTAAEGDRTVLMLRVRKKYSIYHVHRRRTRHTRRGRRNNLNNYAAGIFGTIHQDASERAGARARPSRQSGLKIFSLFDFGGRTTSGLGEREGTAVNGRRPIPSPSFQGTEILCSLL